MSPCLYHNLVAHQDLGKELEEQKLQEQEVELIPKWPGQVSDEIKQPTTEVFEYCYKHFTEANSHK